MRIPALAALLLTLLQGGAIFLSPLPARAALADLDDSAMEQVSGAGVAIGFDQFEFAMAPTSYFEQVGSDPANVCTATGNVAGNRNCWRRGDLRWYGVNISGAGGTADGYHWDDGEIINTKCDSSSLNCPRGGLIAHFSPFDNPYMLRAWSPPGVTGDGKCVNGGTNCITDAAVPTKSVYEFLAPTAQPNYTFSWWGEIEAGSTRNAATQPLTTGIGGTGVGGGIIKSQSIIRGNAAGSVFRLFQLEARDPDGAGPLKPDNTSAIFYHSRLKGDFRFSVAQNAPDAVNNTYDQDRIGQPVVFADTEGLYFRNVDAFIPLGQLYYQALTVDTVTGPGIPAGAFSITLTPIPSGSTAGEIAVQNKHYALNVGDTLGYETARMNNTGGTTSPDYKLTHGYSRWGGWNADGTVTGRNLINGADGSATGDGIYFQACSGCTFFAYAERPARIDKRGSHFSMATTQNYNCATANAGSCTIPGAAGGPVTNGDFTGTQANTCSYMGRTDHKCYTANGAGNGTPTPAGDPTKTYPTTAVNLGDSRIEGLMLQSLRIESCAGRGVNCL